MRSNASLPTDRGPQASKEDLQNIVDVGSALAEAGVGEDELLRLEYSDAPADDRPLSEAVGAYLENREFEKYEAKSNREDLVKSGNRLASLASFSLHRCRRLLRSRTSCRRRWLCSDRELTE